MKTRRGFLKLMAKGAVVLGVLSAAPKSVLALARESEEERQKRLNPIIEITGTSNGMDGSYTIMSKKIDHKWRKLYEGISPAHPRYK